jgi:hypothetical protein
VGCYHSNTILKRFNNTTTRKLASITFTTTDICMSKTYHKIKGIKINPRKVWQLPTGHHSHQTGSGIHNSQPRRQRTRKAIIASSIKEFE